MKKSLLVVKIWEHKISAWWAIGTLLIVLLWPSIPLGGILQWSKFLYYWFPQNFLYVALALISGIYVGTFVYNKKVAPVCPSTTGSKVGILGSIGGVLLGACPACIPVIAIILPLSASIYLSYVSWVFMIIAIAVIIFSIYRMNGFKKI